LVFSHKAAISIFDSNFLYGQGLFETLRIYNGRPFRLQAHLARLIKSGKVIGLSLSCNLSYLERSTFRLIESNRIKNGILRIFASCDRGRPNLIMTAEGRVPYKEAAYKKGFRAKISSIRRNEYSPLCLIKSTNYLDNILARQEAQKSGFEEAIMLNTQGRIAEGSRSNIFIVQNSAIITPPDEEGLLPGITRAAVFDICRSRGLKLRLGRLSVDKLKQAQEAFLTSSLLEVMPLVGVDSEEISAGKPGEITQGLRQAYREKVREELSL
jgi:branched-chain amino acid aminotransferase